MSQFTNFWPAMEVILLIWAGGLVLLAAIYLLDRLLDKISDVVSDWIFRETVRRWKNSTRREYQ